ncbi:hypothetical protein ACWET9_24855 [Streptomyces sp. NPDC004059]
MTAVSLADWAACLSLGASISAAVSIPFWLFVDADLADFDPRPAVRRAVAAGRLDPLLIAVANTRHDAHAAIRQAAVTAAALAMLLTAAPEATR